MYTGAWLRASLSICWRRLRMGGESPSKRRSIDGARASRRRHAQGGADQFAQAVQVDRFADEVESPGLQRVDGRFDAAVGGDHRDRKCG